MARIRVNLVLGGSGIQAGMPTFQEVRGSYQAKDPTVITPNGVLPGIPIGDPRLQDITVLVDVPDDEVNPDGSINKARVAQKYPDHFLTKQGRFA